MKRIYLLLFLLVAFAGSVSAQYDLKLKNNFSVGNDTIKWNTAGGWGRIVRWTFINKGTVALTQAADTIVLKRAYTRSGSNTIRLYLPTAGIAIGDSASYADTVFFTSAPSTNPWTWCDTIQLRHSGSVVTETDMTNNTVCSPTNWKKMGGGVNVGNVIENANGMSLYPNPASSTITVNYNFEANSTANIVIKDMMGKTVNKTSLGNNLSGEKAFNVDVNNLATGMYIMELYVNDTKMVSKFSVEK